MSRRRGEFEHRTSIFEGAFRACRIWEVWTLKNLKPDQQQTWIHWQIPLLTTHDSISPRRDKRLAETPTAPNGGSILMNLFLDLDWLILTCRCHIESLVRFWRGSWCYLVGSDYSSHLVAASPQGGEWVRDCSTYSRKDAWCRRRIHSSLLQFGILPHNVR